MDEVLAAAPLILWSVLFFLLLILARELGAWLRGRVAADRTADDSAKDGYVLSGVLGLLALLVAFTFNLALDRFEQRRTLVIAEANALDTFRLRTQLLEQRANVRSLLRDYVELRLSQSSDPDAQQDRPEAQARAQEALWAATMKALPSPQSPVVAAIVEPLNQAFDAATARTQESLARIPGSVLLTLFGYAMAAAMMVGYAAESARLRPVSYMLFALLTLSITLILDLDRSDIGSIRVSQAAMQKVLSAL